MIKNLSNQEVNLIESMRSTVSQDNTYEVQIITKSYPGGYTLIEYSNTFEINKPKLYQCRNCGKIIDEETYHSKSYSGMCFCEYSPESRILNPFFIIKGDDQNDK